MRLGEIASHPWVRVVVTGLVGLSLFGLGVVYLSLGGRPEVVSFMVVGGETVRAGDRGVIRVSARLADARRTASVRVTDVRIDGKPAGEHVDGERPATVRFQVPSDASDEVQLTLQAAVGEAGQGADDGVRHDTLALRLPVVHGSADVLGAGLGYDELGPVRTAHRVEVVPEAGALAAHMNNRVFVRVRTLEGKPLGGAAVTVEHKALSGGRYLCTTDASGLCSFELMARQPSLRLRVGIVETLPDGQSVRTDTEALLRPYGRRMLLRMHPPVARPGSVPQATLLTWEDRAEVFCDLYAGDSWIWGERVQSEAGQATLVLPRLGEGSHHLQCYEHALEPGEAFATLPVLVSDGDPLEVVLDRARAQRLDAPAGIVAPPGTDAALALAWWQALLRDPPRSPHVLLTTRATDLADRETMHETSKTRLLTAMALVFLLVLLWLGDVILKHIIDTRDRMRAYTLDVLQDDDGQAVAALDEPLLDATFQEREKLVRIRTLLLTVVLLGTIIANVVGFIWLMAIIR